MPVDTAFPALIHVCREPRSFLVQHSGIRFRFSPEAGCEVPFPYFRPELDTMVWSADIQQSVRTPVYSGAHDSWLPRLQHLAMPSATAFSGEDLAYCILEDCHDLGSLSVVFPDSSDDNWVRAKFIEPKRRCKFRRIQPDDARVMTVVNDAWGGRDPEDRITLGAFLATFHEQLDRYGQLYIYLQVHYAGRSWSTLLDSFAPLDRFASTFVECRRGEWVEVCGESGHTLYPKRFVNLATNTQVDRICYT